MKQLIHRLGDFCLSDWPVLWGREGKVVCFLKEVRNATETIVFTIEKGQQKYSLTLLAAFIVYHGDSCVMEIGS